MAGTSYKSGQVSGINQLPATAQGGREFLGYANVRSVANAADTSTADDGVILYTTGNTTRVATLPAANAYVGFMTYVKVDAGTGNITLTPAGTDTINGGSTLSVGASQWNHKVIISDGVSNWIDIT